MPLRHLARGVLMRTRLVRQGRVALERSACGINEDAQQFFALFYDDIDGVYHLVDGAIVDDKCSIDADVHPPPCASSDWEFTLSRFCAERRAQGFQPLTGMGTHPW